MKVIKKGFLFSTLATAILVLVLPMVASAEKTKITGNVTAIVVRWEKVEVGDVKDHTLDLLEHHGAYFYSDPIAGVSINGGLFSAYGTGDHIAGTGPEQGYWVGKAISGETFYGTWKGKLTTTPDAQEVSNVRLKGEWLFTGGTGKLEGIKGGGTFALKFVSPTAWVMKWRGEYELLKK